jgi:peptidoglycan hydrolase FlgJ
MQVPSYFESNQPVRDPSHLANGLLSAAERGLEKHPSFNKTLIAEAQNVSATDTRKIGEPASKPENEDLRKAFQDFVGQTLFSQMISSMRSTQGESAYFNGGRAEKIFQGQLDQMLSEELSNASASQISDPMFKLFQLRRK